MSKHNDYQDISENEWNIIKADILARDGFRCQAACGSTQRLTVHHIIPRKEHGGYNAENLITLCHKCHDEIEDTDIRTIERIRAYDARWHATSEWYNRNPAEHTIYIKPEKKAFTFTRIEEPEPEPESKPKPGQAKPQVTARKTQAEPSKPCRVTPYVPQNQACGATRQPYYPPTIEDRVDVRAVKNWILRDMMDVDPFFDPTRIVQNFENWRAMLVWWATEEWPTGTTPAQLGIDPDSGLFWPPETD